MFKIADVPALVAKKEPFASKIRPEGEMSALCSHARPRSSILEYCKANRRHDLVLFLCPRPWFSPSGGKAEKAEKAEEAKEEKEKTLTAILTSNLVNKVGLILAILAVITSADGTP